jgi:hypothetical protein
VVAFKAVKSILAPSAHVCSKKRRHRSQMDGPDIHASHSPSTAALWGSLNRAIRGDPVISEVILRFSFNIVRQLFHHDRFIDGALRRGDTETASDKMIQSFEHVSLRSFASLTVPIRILDAANVFIFARSQYGRSFAGIVRLACD